MRSRPGSETTLDRKEPDCGGAGYGSPTSGPAVASSRAALSRTVRVSACSATRPLMRSPNSGPSGLRPRVGFRPNTPQHDAGILIEPPASLPCAIGVMPTATAAPAPPLEPPGSRSSDHGFRVGPNSRGSVVTPMASSGRLVLATVISPAALYLRTSSESAVETLCRSDALASVNRTPSYSARKSLSRNGTPASGPSGSGCEARSRARSYILVTTALTDALWRSTRSIAASTSSAAVTSPLRTKAAWPIASRSAISSRDTMSSSVTPRQPLYWGFWMNSPLSSPVAITWPSIAFRRSSRVASGPRSNSISKANTLK